MTETTKPIDVLLDEVRELRRQCEQQLELMAALSRRVDGIDSQTMRLEAQLIALRRRLTTRETKQ